MKMFLDSAKVDEIRHALETWDIDGLTTNPRHVRDSGKSFGRVLDEVAELFSGTDKPVSVEVDPHLTDWRKIVEQGKELARRSPNFVVKIGVGEAGLRAARALTSEGVRVNVTLVFSPAQAWSAARAGATFISPFLGWKDQYGDASAPLIGEVRALLDRHGYRSQIIAAAVRNARQIAEAALAGAHCLTAGSAVYQDAFRSPYTTMGEQIFQQAWDATPKS